MAAEIRFSRYVKKVAAYETVALLGAVARMGAEQARLHLQGPDDTSTAVMA